MTPLHGNDSPYWPFVRGIQGSPVVSLSNGGSKVDLWYFRLRCTAYAIEQAAEWPVIWEIKTLMWRIYNDANNFYGQLWGKFRQNNLVL